MKLMVILETHKKSNFYFQEKYISVELTQKYLKHRGL